MFTRCPQCKTVHSIGAEQLSQARGLVQCGPCGRSFSALSFLFDDWPSGEPHRPASGTGVTLPVLEPALRKSVPDEAPEPAGDAPLMTDAAAVEPPAGDGAELATEASAGDPQAKEPETDGDDNRNTRLLWGSATALLVLMTIANIGWTFRQPLLDSPWVSGLVQTTGSLQVEEKGLLRDPEKIQLVSRDMHTHPTRSGILVLSLTFVNLAARSQVYPELEVTLTDAANQPVAQRRLQPADYLRPGSDTSAGLAADVYLPVLLELGDPGDQAVGFEIRFL